MQWVAYNSLAINETVVLRFPIELESRSVGFRGQWENRKTQRKTLGERMRTNKRNPHMMAVQELNPGHDWWESSALTAVS